MGNGTSNASDETIVEQFEAPVAVVDGLPAELTNLLRERSVILLTVVDSRPVRAAYLNAVFA